MRSILGFAIMAVIVFIALRLVLGLIGVAVHLAIVVLIWAAIGYGMFLLLKLIAPDTARKISETIRGRPAG